MPKNFSQRSELWINENEILSEVKNKYSEVRQACAEVMMMSTAAVYRCPPETVSSSDLTNCSCLLLHTHLRGIGAGTLFRVPRHEKLSAIPVRLQ
jgi:hypothetical protein